MKAARQFGGLLVLAVLGAIMGTLGDQIHTQFRVLTYPRGVWWLFGQAAWVPFLFAGAGPLLIHGHRLSAWMAGGEREHLTKGGIWMPTLWHFAAYLSTGLFFTSPRLLTAGLVLAWLGRVAFRPHRAMVVHSLVCAVGGPIFEGFLSSTGAFTYAHPDFIVPMWLPALYLHVAPVCRHIYVAWVSPPAVIPTTEAPGYLSLKNLDQP